MAQTYVMDFVGDFHGRRDRVGGLPTHKPDEWPTGPDGTPLAFVAQFEVVHDRIPVEGARFIQIYQDPDVDPWPVVVVLGDECQENTEAAGRRHPSLPQLGVAWAARDEPVDSGDWASVESLPLPEEGKLQASKAGGFCYYDSQLDPGERFILQVSEASLPAPIFGGGNLVIVLDTDACVDARLG